MQKVTSKKKGGLLCPVLILNFTVYLGRGAVFSDILKQFSSEAAEKPERKLDGKKVSDLHNQRRSCLLKQTNLYFLRDQRTRYLFS